MLRITPVQLAAAHEAVAELPEHGVAHVKLELVGACLRVTLPWGAYRQWDAKGNEQFFDRDGVRVNA
jgi:hypothetical protein